MASNNRNGKLPNKKIKKTYKASSKTKKDNSPKIFLDRENDFASIRIAPGVESKSYEKNGFVFLEDSKGRVIEIQILNLSHLADDLSEIA